MKVLAMALLAVGLMLFAGGLGYGSRDVKIGADAACGSAISDHSDSFSLTSDGTDQCVAARSGRTAVAAGLLWGGGVALVMAAVAAGVASSETSSTTRAAALADEAQADE